MSPGRLTRFKSPDLRCRQWELDAAGIPAKTAAAPHGSLIGAFLAAGYALRQRHDGEKIVVTLKGLGSAADGIHRRAEYEISLPGPTSP